MMKTTLIRLMPVILALTLMDQAEGQWLDAKGLRGYDVYAFALDGSNVYAAAFGSVYLSTDAGESWSDPGTGLPVVRVMSLGVQVVSPGSSILFAGTGGAGIYRSTNGGASWSGANSGLADTMIMALLTDGAAIYAGTYSEGVFLSSDGGANWFAANAGMGTQRITAIGRNSGAVFAATLNGVFRSTDGGAGWVAADSGLTNLRVNTLLVSDDVLLAATDSGVFRALPGDLQWGKVSNGLPSPVYVSSMTGAGGKIYAGTPTGEVYVSTNGGLAWSSTITSGMKPPAYAMIGIPFAQAPGGFCLLAGGGTQSSTYRSTDAGESWVGVLADPTNPLPLTFKIFGDRLFAANGSEGIFTSENKGSSWTQLTSGVFESHPIAGVLASDSALYAFGGTRVYRSTDVGATWAQLDSSLLIGSIPGSLQVGVDFFVTDGSHIYKSNNGGESWVNAESGLPMPSPEVRGLAKLVTGGDTLMLAATWHGLFASTNHGDLWTRTATGVPDSVVAGILVHGTSLLMTTLRGVASTHLYRSTDRGVSWADAGIELGFRAITSLVSSADEAGQGAPLFVGTLVPRGSNAVLYYSVDDGSSWAALDSLPGPFVTPLAATKADLYVASSASVNLGGIVPTNLLRYPISRLSTVPGADPDVLPSRAHLDQNFPNPFNPSTAISYQLSAGSFVTLRVYDILGRQVATLVNRFEQAGAHKVTFSAPGLASGVYLCRMKAGSFSRTIKLLLMK